MEKPPHSRLASAILAFGAFALTIIAFALIFAGVFAERFDSEWHLHYELGDGSFNLTARISGEDAALWASTTQAAIIAISFYRALRRSRKAAAFWGCVFGALCLAASVIHAVWIWQKWAGRQTDLDFNARDIAGPLSHPIGAAMIFAIGAGALLSALHFRADREVEEDQAICRAHAISARAGFLASLSREASGFRPAIQLLLGVPAFFIFFVYCLYEFVASPFPNQWIRSSQEGSFTVRIRHGPDFPTDPDGTLTLRFGENGLRGVGSGHSTTRAQSVIKVQEIAALFVSEHGRSARIIFVPGPETKFDQLVEMMDAASAGGIEHLEVSTAPALLAP